MSTIIIPSVGRQTVEDLRRTKVEVKLTRYSSSSHDCGVIIGITGLIFAAVFLLGIIGPLIYSYYGGMTGLGMDASTKCEQIIHGFEQSGFYTSQEQFKAAVSYCTLR